LLRRVRAERRCELSGDPDDYKVIFEDDNFRVIAATWKAGTTDKPHTHPVPSIAYSLTDCTLKIHNADGSVREIKGKAGEANAVPIVTQAHRAENPGAVDCRAVIVERK
jgi:hypothetical protein